MRIFRISIKVLDVIVVALVAMTITLSMVGLSLTTQELTYAQDAGTPTAEGQEIIVTLAPIDVTAEVTPPVVVITPVPIPPPEIIDTSRINVTELVLLLVVVILAVSFTVISRTAIINAAAGIPKPALDVIYSIVESAMNSAKPIVERSETKIDDAALGELAQLYERLKGDIAKGNADPSFLPPAAKGGDLNISISSSALPSHPGDADSQVG